MNQERSKGLEVKSRNKLTVDDFILDFRRAFFIQIGNLICEALPLCVLPFWVILCVGVVLPIDQAQIRRRL